MVEIVSFAVAFTLSFAVAFTLLVVFIFLRFNSTYQPQTETVPETANLFVIFFPK